MRQRCLPSISLSPPQIRRLETAITLGESSVDERKEGTRHFPFLHHQHHHHMHLFCFSPLEQQRAWSSPDSPLSELIAEAGSRLGSRLVSLFCSFVSRQPKHRPCVFVRAGSAVFTRRTLSPRSINSELPSKSDNA